MALTGFLSRLMRQRATYWSPDTTDRFTAYGDPNFETPDRIDVRWEDRQELFINSEGDQMHSKAIVWSLDAIAVGGYLYRGESTTAAPESVTGADQIRRVEITWDTKGRTALYKSFL